ncbi:MAG: DUF4446 family protein [Eubacteriales bacterium]|nr:DUF4446 family protein [Eubacteriales bacterium]
MSQFLTNIGLGFVDLGIVVLVLLVIMIVLIVLVIVQMRSLKALQRKYLRFMNGSNGRSLEDEIGRILEENARIHQENEENKKEIDHLYDRLENVIQKVGVVKYDAFHQMGGKLSYAVALLDEKNTGLVLNSVHSVDGCYTYVKVVKKGKSDVDLGAEEQKALQQAMGQ